MSAHPHAVAPTVLSDAIPGDRVRDVLLTVGYAAAIAVAAQIYFFLPGNPVPITAQTFVVLTGAIVLGSTRAGIGATGYLALGIAGVPLFAAANGATLGYIIGFAAAAMLLGTLAQRGHLRGPLQVAGAMIIGNLVIYALGVAWIAAALQLQPGFLSAFGLEATPGLTGLLTMFVVPFLIGDAVKIAAATAIVPLAWRLIRRNED